MTGLDDLGRHVAREQDALRARSPMRAEVRARLDALEVPHRQPRRWPQLLGASVAATAMAAGIALAVWPRVAEPNLLAVTIGEAAVPGTTGSWVEAPSHAPVAMRFSDGTRVDVAPSSRARIAELTPRGAHILLENGLARVHVRPRAEAAFRVSAGPFAVKVTGTQFDIRWSPEQDAFELDLTHGRVEISGCVFGQSYELSAGQRALASCRQGRLSVGSRTEMAAKREPAADARDAQHAAASPQPAAAAPTGEEAEAARVRSPRSNAAVSRGKVEWTSRWRSLAEAGRYADALRVVRKLGFAAECRRADAPGLLLLADLARYGRSHDDASLALHMVRRRFARTPQAAQAAFALGKLHFDHDGSYAEAAWWFRTYLRERPSGALAREASGRLLEATLRSGETAAASELAAQYLREYPNGPHAALASSVD